MSYIIWNPKSTNPPTKAHDNRPVAIKVATKMAAENPGEIFYVCKIVGECHAPNPLPKYVDLDK